jgi:hypothetical protein
MPKRSIIIAMFLSLFSQSLEGVYQLEIEDQDGKVISKGTGFYVRPEHSIKSYVLTSFHLLNSRLLEAAKIKIADTGKDIYLKVAAYDELTDVLALYSDEMNDRTWTLAKDCSGKINIAGYHSGKFCVIDVEDGMDEISDAAVKRLPVYLSKGFSGAPLLNEKAEVCGMVVLSSEQNASSIAVSNGSLRSVLNNISKQPYSIRELRVMMGTEKIVHDQEELDRLALDPNNGRQFVIGLAPTEKTQRFVIKNAANVIIDAYSDISKLLIHRSKNIMVRNIKADRLMINESSDVTVTGCIFNTLDQALLLKDSSNLYVKGNLFKGMDTGIVLKAVLIDEKDLASDNVFVSVPNNIKNI